MPGRKSAPLATLVRSDRITLWLLPPISLLIAVNIQQACRRVFPPIRALPLKVRQMLPMGPVASQEAIKMLGTNGWRLLTPTQRIRLKTQPR